jgi:hypothetical protein
MPWELKGNCVHKKGSAKPVPGGCHKTRQEAVKHMSALYANEKSMTAAAPPLKPPLDWFHTPEADVPTPLTIHKDGRVEGHLALWDTCHTGFLNGGFSECVKAPRSQTDYSFFNLAPLETAEGTDVYVGRLTYGTGHAPLSAGLQAASSHYDNTGAVGAFVRASDGQHGVWLAGAVRSDIAAEGLRDLRANPPSGDWRALNRNLELIASLAVPVPGFPIPRSQLALSASAAGDMEVSALILPGFTTSMEAMGRREYLRRRTALAAAVITSRG